MHIRKRVAAFVASVLATATFTVCMPGVAVAGTNKAVAEEVAAALDAVDNHHNKLVIQAAPSVTDGTSAARTSDVDIPVDPTRGVTLKGKNGKSLTVKLPNARKSNKGKKARNGVVVYGDQGNSLNAVIPGANGSLQAWTHIRNRKATETFRYCVEGVQHFRMLDNGGVTGVDRTGQPVTFVLPPTATEKNTGKTVPTSYKSDGNCLVQHVAHKTKGTSYPVMADPHFQWHWNGVVVTLTPSDMLTVAYGGTQALAAMLAVPGLGWASYAVVLSASGWALWAYQNRQCFWFWLSLAPWDPTRMGTYTCR